MSDTVQAATVAPLKPFAVPIPVARTLLSKCRTGIYDAVGRGELDAVKDGPRTLITLASIERYSARLKPGLAHEPKELKSFPRDLRTQARRRTKKRKRA
jgi:hypothetical protein